MKRLIASAGMIAVGTTSLCAADVFGMTPQETAKPYSISAALRGFYDDNYAIVPNALKRGSGGIEAKPGAEYNRVMGPTAVSLAYEYGLKYYFNRPGNAIDQSHELQAKVDHRFSNRYSVRFYDSFVYSQEPEVIDATFTARQKATAIRNRAALDFNAFLTERWGAEVGYQNNYYNYIEDGPGSYSALLDRMEHMFHLDAQYLMRGAWENPATMVFAGYQYGIANYTSNDLLVDVPDSLTGDSRDNTGHYFYVGGKYSFSSQVKVMGKAGVQLTDFTKLNQTELGPFADISGMYYYLPNSYLQVGVRAQQGATDLAGLGTAGSITLNSQSYAMYANVSHRITPRITGSLLGQFQYSSYNGGIYDSETDSFFILGVNAEYKINQFLTAEAGYNFDHVTSGIPGRGYSRNRVFAGVQARY